MFYIPDMQRRFVLSVLGLFVIVGAVAPTAIDAVYAKTKSGAVDPRFGTRGVLEVGPRSKGVRVSTGFLSAMTRDATGRLIVLGSIETRSRDTTVFLKRFRTDGSSDRRFANSGSAVVKLPGWDQAGADSVTVQRDGRILVAGWAFRDTPSGGKDALTVARFTSRGRLDRTFGKQGVRTVTAATEFPYFTNSSITLDDQQRIVLTANGCRTASAAPSAQVGLCVVRLGRSGTIDKGFGVSGIASMPVSAGGIDYVGAANSVLVDKAGRIVVAGYGSQGMSSRLALARFTAAGAADASFGQGGLVLDATLPTASDNGLVVRALSSGQLLVAATGSNSPLDPSAATLALQRYEQNGSLDKSFGLQGTVIVSSATGLLRNSRLGFESDKTGFLLTGVFGNRLKTFRLLASGEVDLSFGASGVTTFGKKVVGTAGPVLIGRAAYVGGTSDSGKTRRLFVLRLTR